MIDFFGIYFNTYLADIFDNSSSQYQAEMEELKRELEKSLNSTNLNLLEDYSISVKNHMEEIAMLEIEKAFYRGFYFSKNFNDFIDRDID